VVQVTSLESGGSISASTSLSLSIEGVCSELVHTPWFRLSCRCVARVSNGHFTDIRVMHCLIKTCLVAPYTQTGYRRKREGVSAYTWRIKMLRARRKSFVAFSPPSAQFLGPSTDGQDAEQEHRKKASRMSSHSMREAS